MTWISVKDRLPNKDHKKIVCLINGKCVLCDVHEETFILTTNQVSFYWPTQKWVKDDLYADVTHWMPLPSPPQEY